MAGKPQSLEDIRTFFVRRPWMHGDDPESLLTTADYAALKDRRWDAVSFSASRIAYLRAFIDGWKAAKP